MDSSYILWNKFQDYQSKVCFKSFVNFITSRIFEVEAKFKLFWKVYQKDIININRKSETPGILVVSRDLKK